MPKRDRKSKVHKQELIERMVTKENIDRPGLNLTEEDMSEALIDDRVQAWTKKRDEDDFNNHLRAENP